MLHSSVAIVVVLLSLVPWCLCSSDTCDIADKNARFDCHPDPSVTEASCTSRGCCWQPSTEVKSEKLKRPINVPYCYFPNKQSSYNVTNWNSTDFGYTGTLFRSTASGWPNDVKTLSIQVWFETKTRLHFKISDPSSQRYEVPIETPPTPTKAESDPEYDITYRQSPFGITISRKSNKVILFDSVLDSAPLIFADQFIQISSRLSTHLLYGLGGRKSTLLHDASNWQQFAMWARDQPPQFNSNLYGSHPFYLNIESDGQAHGVFLLNSNAMDVDVQPLPAVTFRTIGGVLDFYVFTGPTAADVIRQYTEVIGRPQLPPYWGLGFHLCRYNYGSVTNLKTVIERNRKLGIPYEVQWTDIDYMDRHLDWTYDKNAFTGLPDVVKDLHEYGQKYVIIVDPGISNQYSGQYVPYDTGVKAGVFILNATGDLLIGKVWPGTTVFPDFTNPKAADWWYDQMRDFHNVLPFDGLWTDMNEPSDFVSGSTTGCTTGLLDHPPYVPGISGDGTLAFSTICPSAKQHVSTHYNLHNMFGLLEANATSRGLHKLLGKRSIVISRSSFPSLGRHGGHWTGDISSTWEDLYYSIPGILEYQFYGIPLVGADICGFGGDTTEELCVRWMQLGSFYPFMRNHNDDRSTDQDPGAFSPSAQNIMKFYLELRYALLPFFYTRFYFSHISGSPVIQPLFFQYPDDENTYTIDKQFMWGSELLISPVLEQGHTDVSAYFPADLWYEIYSGVLIDSHGEWMTLKAPLEVLHVHVRGGSIVPLQEPNITTSLARRNPFVILVAFNRSNQAFGSLYWDDGDSLGAAGRGQYNFICFTAAENSINSTVIHTGYWPNDGMYLDAAVILGVAKAPSSATVNGKPAKVQYTSITKELDISSFQADLLKPIYIEWH